MKQKLGNPIAITLTLTLGLSLCSTLETPKAQANISSSNENLINDIALKAAINAQLTADHTEKHNLDENITIRDLQRLYNKLDASCETTRKLVDACVENVAGLEHAKNLVELDISHNQLESLPDSFGKLTQLQTLYIEGSGISSLPDSFGNLTQLQTLNILNTRISSLPDSFGNLTQLQTLNIGYNNISSLPDIFGNLTQLQNLNMSFNKLESLPDIFGNLNSLKVFTADWNHLSDISALRNNPQVKISAIGQESQGREIIVSPNEPICTNIVLPVRWDNTSFLPTQRPEKYTFTPTPDENPISKGKICWNNVSNATNQVEYEFDASETADKQFTGSQTFKLNRQEQ